MLCLNGLQKVDVRGPMSSEECRYSVRTPVQLHSELGYSGVLNKVKNLMMGTGMGHQILR